MNILVTGAWREAKNYIPNIEASGHKVCFLQNEKESIPCDKNLVEGIIGNGIFLSHSIESFPNLRYIQLTSAGYDRVPIDYISAKNIKIFNARGVYDTPISEMVLTGVLCLYKKVGTFFVNKNKHTWEKQRSLPEICGKNVTILGCGSIGTKCAQKFKAFGAEITGVDIRKIDDPVYDHVYFLENADEALINADIVVVTLPLTDSTKWFINKERIEIMKPGCVLVNVSRGEIVKTDDLIAALKGKLAGAVLDVFENEPLEENSPLWDMENVFITPHNSFIGEGNKKRLADLIVSNLNKEG